MFNTQDDMIFYARKGKGNENIYECRMELLSKAVVIVNYEPNNQVSDTTKYYDVWFPGCKTSKRCIADEIWSYILSLSTSKPEVKKDPPAPPQNPATFKDWLSTKSYNNVASASTDNKGMFNGSIDTGP